VILHALLCKGRIRLDRSRQMRDAVPYMRNRGRTPCTIAFLMYT